MANYQKARTVLMKQKAITCKKVLFLRGGGEDEAGPEDALENANQDGNAGKQASHESEPWLRELEEKLKTELGEDGKPLSKNEVKRRLKAARVEREREEKKEKQKAAALAKAG